MIGASSFGSLTREHGRSAAELTLAEVTDRVCRWLLAVDNADLASAFDRSFATLRYHDVSPFAALRALVGPAQRAAAEPGVPTADLADLVRRLEGRFGGELPPSLVTFWELRARSRQWRELFDALISPTVFAPTAYLHGYGAEYRLSIAQQGNGSSWVHESLDGEYAEWYDEEQVVSKATAGSWPGLRIGDMVMLDPTVAYSLIEVAWDHGQWVELVGDWRDDAGEAPIFRAGDDFDAYVNLIGVTIPQWLGLEIDATLARLVAPDVADAVSLGASLLRPA